ncbi:Endov [Symbiodinium natans]|uniref:Endov protein n=1 Tax=Symbiodinium natans TaxID=878477 RepID=A0A812QAX4_9DINO|nr:Endov [Symbiodinium natans]
MVSREQKASWAAEQIALAKLRVEEDCLDWSISQEKHGFPGLSRVGGVDVSFFADGTYAIAAVVVLSFPSLKVIYERSAAFRLSVPYVPGFLAMREVPALSKLFQDVPADVVPQVVLVDGNGAFHPRQCGAATHLGLSIGLPTIGVAKDVQQVGQVNSSTARRLATTLSHPGQWAPLCSVAALLKTKGKCLVVSPGHRISLQTAVALASHLCHHNLPEPIRQADLRSRQAVRAWYAGVEFEYLVAPRLSHLEQMLEIMSRETCHSPAECRSAPKSRPKWVIKEQPRKYSEGDIASSTAAPSETEEAQELQENVSGASWTGLLFGWLCVCFTR